MIHHVELHEKLLGLAMITDKDITAAQFFPSLAHDIFFESHIKPITALIFSK